MYIVDALIRFEQTKLLNTCMYICIYIDLKACYIEHAACVALELEDIISNGPSPVWRPPRHVSKSLEDVQTTPRKPPEDPQKTPRKPPENLFEKKGILTYPDRLRPCNFLAMLGPKMVPKLALVSLIFRLLFGRSLGGVLGYFWKNLGANLGPASTQKAPRERTKRAS